MPRLIDADMLEPSEVYMNYGFTRIVYMDDIDELPTVDAEPVRHGHWEVDEDGNVKCSECGHSGVGDNYCERCGAKMNEVEDD